jgi:hypothetical protein
MVVRRARYKRPVVYASLERAIIRVSIIGSRNNSSATDTFRSKSSSTHLVSGLSRDIPAIVNDQHLDLNTSHPTSWHLDPRVPGDITETKREPFSSASRQNVGTNSGDNGVARIGYVLDNGHFVCDDQVCVGRTFARQADLRRHYTTLHAANKPNFWCHVSACRRSIGGGREAFHRKDKLKAHVRSMHRDM